MVTLAEAAWLLAAAAVSPSCLTAPPSEPPTRGMLARPLSVSAVFCRPSAVRTTVSPSVLRCPISTAAVTPITIQKMIQAATTASSMRTRRALRNGVRAVFMGAILPRRNVCAVSRAAAAARRRGGRLQRLDGGAAAKPPPRLLDTRRMAAATGGTATAGDGDEGGQVPSVSRWVCIRRA